MDVFRRKYTHYISQPLNISAMKKAAAILVGIHDFRSFSSGKNKKSTEKQILKADIISSGSDELHIILDASAFLRQMPRLIAGTLLDIGLGARDIDCIPAILSGQDAPSAPVPAQGLCLTDTCYE